MKKGINKVRLFLSIILMIGLSIIYSKFVDAAALAVSANGNNVTISSSYTGKVNVAVSGGTASQNEVWLENNSQTIAINVNDASKGASVTVSPGSMSNSEGQLIDNKDIPTKSVKIAATNTQKNTSNTNTNTNSNTKKTEKTEEKVTESSAKGTTYATGDINLRESYSTSSESIGSVKQGDSVTIIGTTSNGWTKVTYNGKTGYIKSSLLSNEEPTKSADKSLKELKIDKEGLNPVFSPETTDYTLTVDSDVEKLEITATPANEKAKVEITGNEDFKTGDNIVKITVTAEDETTRIYTINVKKESASGLELKNLLVSGYKINPEFSATVFEYKINVLDPNVNSLNITATPAKEDSTVTIEGNDNLKAGENIIKISVKSADGSETVVYQITVNKPNGTAVANTKGKSNLIKYVAIAAAIILVIIIIVVIIKSRKRKDEFDDEEQEENYDDLYGYSSKTNKKENHLPTDLTEDSGIDYLTKENPDDVDMENNYEESQENFEFNLDPYNTEKINNPAEEQQTEASSRPIYNVEEDNQTFDEFDYKDKKEIDEDYLKGFDTNTETDNFDSYQESNYDDDQGYTGGKTKRRGKHSL